MWSYGLVQSLEYRGIEIAFSQNCGNSGNWKDSWTSIQEWQLSFWTEKTGFKTYFFFWDCLLEIPCYQFISKFYFRKLKHALIKNSEKRVKFAHIFYLIILSLISSFRVNRKNNILYCKARNLSWLQILQNPCCECESLWKWWFVSFCKG